MKNNENGFTLIELLAVIVILGTIMAIVGTSVLNQRKRANVEEAKKIEDTIETLGPDIWFEKKESGKYSLDILANYGLKNSIIKNPNGNGNCEGYLEITDDKEFIGHICCLGLYQTDGDEVPTDCRSYQQ